MRTVTSILMTIAIVIFPNFAQGADGPVPIPESESRLRLNNIELTAAGDLNGQYVTPQGLPLANETISVTVGKDRQEVVTDASGRFVVRNLKGGQCVFSAGDEAFACRLWANGTAPPNSLNSVAVVKSAGSAVRGQSFLPGTGRLSALSQTQRVALGLLVVTGTTLAIVEGVSDGS